MMLRHLLIFLALQPAFAAEPVQDTRHRSTRAAFQHEHPCPLNGKKTGACPGFVGDHITPLCAGGPDTTANLRWADSFTAARRDKEEWALCRAIKKQAVDGSNLCEASRTLKLAMLMADLCE